MTISEAFDNFMLDRAALGSSSKTLIDYRQKIGVFLRWVGDVDLDMEDLSLSFCRKYVVFLREKSISSVTLQAYVRSLRAFLNWSYREGFISEDICHRFRLPKAQRKVIDVLTDDEVRKLLDAVSGPRWVDARNTVIILLMLDCGLRLNEVVCASRDGLHLHDRFIIVNGKGDKQRAVPFGFSVEFALSDYLRQSDPFDILIISGCRNGSQKTPAEGISYESVKDLFRTLIRKTGIKRLHPHLLRHTFATRYLENGGNIYGLQSILGHTTLTMCQKYLHLSRSHIVQGFVNYSPVDRFLQERSAAAMVPPENEKTPSDQA